MPQLTYAQAKALKTKIVERLTEIFQSEINEKQKKYDADPLHKQIEELNFKKDQLKTRRDKIYNDLKKKHNINSYLSPDGTRNHRFKKDNLIDASLSSNIMDDLIIYTIGTDGKKVDPQEIIEKFVKKYSDPKKLGF